MFAFTTHHININLFIHIAAVFTYIFKIYLKKSVITLKRVKFKHDNFITLRQITNFKNKIKIAPRISWNGKCNLFSERKR